MSLVVRFVLLLFIVVLLCMEKSMQRSVTIVVKKIVM